MEPFIIQDLRRAFPERVPLSENAIFQNDYIDNIGGGKVCRWFGVRTWSQVVVDGWASLPASAEDTISAMLPSAKGYYGTSLLVSLLCHRDPWEELLEACLLVYCPLRDHMSKKERAAILSELRHTFGTLSIEQGEIVGRALLALIVCDRYGFSGMYDQVLQNVKDYWFRLGREDSLDQVDL